MLSTDDRTCFGIWIFFTARLGRGSTFDLAVSTASGLVVMRDSPEATRSVPVPVNESIDSLGLTEELGFSPAITESRLEIEHTMMFG